jgi:hypothetical protein
LKTGGKGGSKPPSKKKKKDGSPFSRNSILVSGLRGGNVRLLTTSELSEEALESSVLIVETLSGALPLMPKEEALQTCYDAILEGCLQTELPELGQLLARLSAADGSVLQ